MRRFDIIVLLLYSILFRMIHKVLLQFTEDSIEEEYLNSQKKSILASYLNFTCYVSVTGYEN